MKIPTDVTVPAYTVALYAYLTVLRQWPSDRYQFRNNSISDPTCHSETIPSTLLAHNTRVAAQGTISFDLQQ